MPQLLEAVSKAMGVDPEKVRKPSKSRAPAMVRAIICYLAIFEFGYSGSEVGRFLYLGSSGVSLAARRGEKFARAEPEIIQRIISLLEK